jgi:hypothetical protein
MSGEFFRKSMNARTVCDSSPLRCRMRCSEGFNRYHAILGASALCVATHPSDMCVALAALDATVHLRGKDGARMLPFIELHRLPGDHPDIDTVLEPGELITAIELPPLPFAARVHRDRPTRVQTLLAPIPEGIMESGRDIAGAFLEVQNHAPPICPASHEGRCYRRNANLDKSDAGVRIVVLRAPAKDNDGLARFDHRETFPDRCHDRTSRDRPSRGRMVREMGRGPCPQLMIVRQSRQGFERKLLRIYPVFVCQPVVRPA